MTIGPEGRGSRSEGAIEDSSEQDAICFKRLNKKELPKEKHSPDKLLPFFTLLVLLPVLNDRLAVWSGL